MVNDNVIGGGLNWGYRIYNARDRRGMAAWSLHEKIVTLISKRKKGFFVDCSITLFEG